MSKIEILTLQDMTGGGGADERYSFTMPAAPYVVPDLAINAIPAAPYFRNALGNSRFQVKDNLIIRSIGVWLPYTFTLSTVIPRLLLRWKIGGIEAPILAFGSGSGYLDIPQENYELIVDTYIPWPNFPPAPAAGVALPICARVQAAMRVSIINAPAMLAATTLPFVTWAKVEHNLDMIA